MTSSLVGVAAVEGTSARRGLSSKVLQMKFMQRRESPNSASLPHSAPLLPSSDSALSAPSAGHQWVVERLPSSSSSRSAAAVTPQSHILIETDDFTTPPAFVSGRRSFGRNKALEQTLAEVRAGTQGKRGEDRREEEERQTEDDGDEEKDVSSRAGGVRSSEGGDGGGGRGARRERGKRENDNGKRRATLSVTDMGREDQRRKKQQRLQAGFLRPPDTN